LQFFVQLAVCDVGMWYRWIHGILKELEAESKIKDVIAEPKSLMEKYYPHIRRYVREILESIRNFDGTEHECKEKVDATAAEIVHLTETTGLSTGRNPLAIVAAAISISLQIHAKSLKTDERKVILPLAKRDEVAARLGAGKDTTRQRDQEIRTQLVKMAAQSPWVLIKVDDKTVIDVWHSIAPVIRLGNADRHRQSNEALRKMREKVETFGTPGDSKDIKLAEHGWTTGVPKTREESREVPKPLQAEPGLVTPASIASIVPLALPTIKSKRKAANPQPEKSAADGIPPAVVSVSGDMQVASSSSHDTQLTTSNPTNNAQGSVDELVLPSPIQVEEKPRVTADDVVKQIYPGSFFPAFKNSMDTRKTRCYQIRQAISRLKDSHLTHTLPFDAWEAALTSISVEIDAPIKAEDEEDEKKDPDVVATPARYKKPIFHHNKLGQKVGKSKKQSAVDVDKKQLSPDDHMIETLLVEGASVLDIVEQGEDLRSLLDHTPAKLARLEMMLNVEEKAPEGELSQVSAFLPEQDPDFQMRTADQQKLVRAFLDSEYVASTQRGYVRKKAKVEPSSPTMLDMDIPGPIDGNYADDYDDIDVEEENRRQQLRAKNLNRPSQSNEDDIEDDQDGPNYI
jgi:hypothetical protein